MTTDALLPIVFWVAVGWAILMTLAWIMEGRDK